VIRHYLSAKLSHLSMKTCLLHSVKEELLYAGVIGDSHSTTPAGTFTRCTLHLKLQLCKLSLPIKSIFSSSQATWAKEITDNRQLTDLRANSHIFQQEAQLPQRNSASAAHVKGRGPRPSSPLSLLWLHLRVWSNPKATTYVRQACRP